MSPEVSCGSIRDVFLTVTACVASNGTLCNSDAVDNSKAKTPAQHFYVKNTYFLKILHERQISNGKRYKIRATVKKSVTFLALHFSIVCVFSYLKALYCTQNEKITIIYRHIALLRCEYFTKGMKTVVFRPHKQKGQQRTCFHKLTFPAEKTV